MGLRIPSGQCTYVCIVPLQYVETRFCISNRFVLNAKYFSWMYTIDRRCHSHPVEVPANQRDRNLYLEEPSIGAPEKDGTI